MAKKKSKDDEGRFPQGDVADAEQRRAESEGVENPDTREDGDDEADPNAPAERPAGSEEFQVVDAGTVIDGQHYPRSKGPEHEKMLAFLPAEQAQELVNNGVRLKKDNEDMVAEPKEEPQQVDGDYQTDQDRRNYAPDDPDRIEEENEPHRR